MAAGRLSRLILNFRFLADRCTTLEELAVLLEAAARELDFEFVAMLHSNSLARSSEQLIRHDNYPPGWDKRLVGRGHRVIDPVLSFAQRTSTGFPWPIFPRRVTLTSLQKDILLEGVRHGLRQGFTVPANVLGEPPASITFATRRARQISRERQILSNMVGGVAFEAARRIKGLAVDTPRVPHLHERAVECVFWIAHGKTDRDVADILGVHLETVRSYVKTAFRVLGVITRAQLVHEALRLGLIDFVASIPPFG